MLEGLIQIYDVWRDKLDQLNEPYYLKLWLFEPHFSNSQVVCAIGESIHSYDETFYKPESKKPLQPKYYGELNSQISEFTWDYYLDEEHWNNSEPGSPEEYASADDFEEVAKRFRKMMKKPHRTTNFPEPVGEATEYYSFKKGDVWLGEK